MDLKQIRLQVWARRNSTPTGISTKIPFSAGYFGEILLAREIVQVVCLPRGEMVEVSEVCKKGWTGVLGRGHLARVEAVPA